MFDFLFSRKTASHAAGLLRYLGIGVVVCGAVAAFFSLGFNEPFARVMVVSLCIGLTCQVLIDGGRRIAARCLLHLRPDEPALRRGWPGWAWTLPIIVAGSWLGIEIGYSLAGSMLGVQVHAPGVDRPRAAFLVLAVSVMAAIAVIYWSWSRTRLAASEAQAQAAQRLAAENQLKLLESQLEPHMLFNTLANLRVLIGLDPPRAQAMLDRLIAFLRATLQASRSGTHSLADEFARLEDYLALMAVRMGPRLAAHFELPEALRATPVPPLLLQPLVENCIKHGLEPQLAGGRIEVRAERRANKLLLSVHDDGAGLAAQAAQTAQSGTHFGLEQVRQRLAALYGSAASFELQGAPGGGTLARIELPLELATTAPSPPCPMP